MFNLDPVLKTNELKDPQIKDNNANQVDLENRISVMHDELLDKKNSIVEIEKIIDPIMKKNAFKKIGIIGKIKALLTVSENSNDSITLMSSVIGGFMLITIIPIVSLWMDSKLTQTMPFFLLVLLEIIIAFFSVNYLYKSHCEQVLISRHKEDFNYQNIDQDILVKLSVYFDDMDKELILDANKRNKMITIKDILNVLKRKEVWIEKNESMLRRLKQEQQNYKILN